jgi:hypothetical protein
MVERGRMTVPTSSVAGGVHTTATAGAPRLRNRRHRINDAVNERNGALAGPYESFR